MIDVAAHGKWMWSASPGGRPTSAVARLHRRVAGRFTGPQERVLARCRMRHGGSAVGTDRALIITSVDGSQRRVSWTDIADAAWSPITRSTIISLWPDGRDPLTRIDLPTERWFAALAAERVAATQILRRHVRLTGAAAATVLALRAVDGEVAWRVIVDGGEHDDPDLERAISRVVAELRDLTGC